MMQRISLKHHIIRKLDETGSTDPASASGQSRCSRTQESTPVAPPLPLYTADFRLTRRSSGTVDKLIATAAATNPLSSSSV